MVVSHGKVFLVGAGPGHPDYLTVAAAVPPDATVYFAGKRCGDHTLSQEEIHEILIREAGAGKRVVRLQGGDPSLFGRLGEETAALRARGIAFEVIPGVSSLTAGAARAGFPLTLRGVAGQVRVVDGHALDEAGFDFASLAAFDGTLVFFMAAGKIEALVAGLLAAGMDEQTPIALVESATCATEHVAISTLVQARAHGLSRVGDGPGIVYVGRVVGMNASGLAAR
jgi:uroporphyrin-III C-methyltransferase